MADSVTLNLDINNSLLKSFEETNKVASLTNDKISEMEQNLSKGAGVLDKMKGSLNSVVRTFSRVGTTMGSFFAVGGIFDAARGILEVDQNMRNLSFQMGHGATQVKNFRDGVYEVSSATGLANQEISSMFTTFARARIAAGDIERLAEATGHFTQITGASADSAAGLASNLSRVGRLGTDGVENVMKSIVSVQREFGLAANEVEQLTDGMTGVTQMLSQMGKDSAFIENFNKGLARMAGSFTEVGLEANQALDIVNQLLDPSKLEDNALLYAKMGISIQDAISGNINPDQISAGLKDIGMQLQNMSGPQAAAMAAQLGMPLQELRAMAELDLSPTESGIESLADASAEQKGPLRMITEFWNSIQNQIAGILSDVLPLLTDGIGKLFKYFQNNDVAEFFKNMMGNLQNAGKFLKTGLIVAAIGGMMLLFRKLRKNLFSTADATRKSLIAGVSEGLEMGYKKGEEKISRLRATRGRAQSQARGERMRMRMSTDRGQTALGLAGSAESFQQLGNQPKILNSMLGVISNINREYAKTGGFYNEFNIYGNMINNNLRETHRRRVDTYNQEIQILEIAQQQVKSDKIKEKIGQQITKLQERAASAKQRELMFMNKDERNALLENNQLRQTNLKNELNLNREKLLAIRDERELNQGVVVELRKKLESGKLSAKEQWETTKLSAKEQWETTQELNKHLEIERQLNEERKEAVQSGKDLNAELRSSREEGGQIEQAQQATFGEKFFAGLKTVISRPFDNLRNGFTRVGMALKQNGGALGLLRKGITTLSKKMAGGLLKGIGGLAKMAIPLMLIAPLMQKIQPLLDVLIAALNPIFDILKDVIGELLIALAPLFATLVNTLFPPLLTVLGGLLIIIGKLVSAIGELGAFMSVDLPIRIREAVRVRDRKSDEEIDAEIRARRQSSLLGRAFEGMAQMGTSLQDTGVNLMATGMYYMQPGVDLVNSQDLQNSLRTAMAGSEGAGAEQGESSGSGGVVVGATGSGFELSANNERREISDTIEESSNREIEIEEEQARSLESILAEIEIMIGLKEEEVDAAAARAAAEAEAEAARQEKLEETRNNIVESEASGNIGVRRAATTTGTTGPVLVGTRANFSVSQ